LVRSSSSLGSSRSACTAPTTSTETKAARSFGKSAALSPYSIYAERTEKIVGAPPRHTCSFGGREGLEDGGQDLPGDRCAGRRRAQLRAPDGRRPAASLAARPQSTR